MQYTIIVDKQSRSNPSSDKKTYTIEVEELRTNGNVSDSLVITKDDDYVLRKLKLTEFNVLEELSEPVKEPLNDLNINLFEGDNYIYLIDTVGNKFYAEYLIKNDFNDTYVTKNEMNSAINQSAGSIELIINQKLDNYSTTTEMNSAIKLSADSINSEVKKKVGNDEIISKINQSAETVGISADRIELTANDILNLLAGNEINLGSKVITIKSTNFSVDKDGNMTCNNAVMKNSQIEGGSLKIWGNTSLDGLRVFKDSSKNINYMAYIVSDSIGINNGDSSAAMLADYIGTGNSSMTPNEVKSPTITQTSLASQKKNFEKLPDGALEILKQIDIYKYNLKNEKDQTKKHIGFVIGDGYNYSEEVTSTNNQGVDNYSFTSLCCKAIQEQQKQIEELNSKINKLTEEKAV